MTRHSIMVLAVCILVLPLCCLAQDRSGWQQLTEDGNKLFQDGKVEQAEKKFQQALYLAEKTYGPTDARVAHSLGSLGTSYAAQGRVIEAEALMRFSIDILERGGRNPTEQLSIVNNLASLYAARGRFHDAAIAHKKCLEISEKAFGADDPRTASALMDLAAAYASQENFAEAEPLVSRALQVYEKALGKENPQVAAALNNLGNISAARGKYEEAENHFRQALAMYERLGGPDNPELADLVENLGGVYQELGKQAEAKQFADRAAKMRSKKR
ncbi:MAG TPA: tetratricopeptide repeat protein [Desulfomonilaceae bacterium]|nr:tetratricopeptide repeat protein [Desulfomonilaceae bacterium]